MKKLLLFIVMFLGLMTMTGCKNECKKNGHSWLNATATSPKTCENCGETEGDPLTGLQAILPTSTSSKVELPTEFEGKSVTWKSLSKDVMLDNGTIIAIDADKIATLVATLTDPTTSEVTTETCQILVKSISVNKGTYDYAYNYYISKLDGELSKDVKLITREYNGCTVIYESLDESVITSSGTIFKSVEEQTAIMNIYVLKDGIAILYPTTITVADYNAQERIEFASAKLDKLVEDYQDGKIDSLPVYDDYYDVELNWVSNNPTFLVLEDRVLPSVDICNVRLDCTLQREEIVIDTITKKEKIEITSANKKYELTNVGGNLTEAEYLNIWLKSIMPTEIIAHKNTVYDKYGTGELFFKSQYATNKDAVLNLIDGKDLEINKSLYIDAENFTGPEDKKHWTSLTHSPLTTTSTYIQDVYNHFYDGYVIPNKENILWIVVHESGMAGEGNDAELLAQIQYDRVYGTRPYGGASWHYQVDDGEIYQSYDDNVYCWHAGGDYGKWLPYRNSHSIGIEMCINQDGNYDGAMVHDAKLVAELMHRYNLNLDNVVRHHDTSGKICPAYMLETGRYTEFLHKVSNEYVAMKYLKDAQVEWTISDESLFTKAKNGLWYAKAVSKDTDVTIRLKVTKGSYTFNETVTLTLHPDTE